MDSRLKKSALIKMENGSINNAGKIYTKNMEIQWEPTELYA
jgi:hypothetical protein